MSRMKTQPWLLVLFCALALTASACHKDETNNTAADTTTTTTSGTDTSATTSTMDTGSTSKSGTTGSATSLDKDDSEFVTKAAEGGMAEVMVGQMAASKAISADVKSFANRMVTDHGKANDELKQLAQNKGLTLPSDTDKDHKEAADKLSKLSGKDFDKKYMDDMVEDHEKVARAFEKASKDSKDPDLKAWATNTLPTIKDHLKMAKDTKSKVK